MAEENQRKFHPIWDLYDSFRTARLNVNYYSKRLKSLNRLNLLFEITLAITVPSSAFAGLWLWETEYGRHLWKYIAVFSALLAVLKPFMKITQKIAKMEEILAGYRSLDHELYVLTVQIKQNEIYDVSWCIKETDGPLGAFPWVI